MGGSEHFLVLLLLFLFIAIVKAQNETCFSTKTIYNFSAISIDGSSKTDFSVFKGKVVLIANVASF